MRTQWGKCPHTSKNKPVKPQSRSESEAKAGRFERYCGDPDQGMRRHFLKAFGVCARRSRTTNSKAELSMRLASVPQRLHLAGQPSSLMMRLVRRSDRHFLYVYILVSETNEKNACGGVTRDLNARLCEHNQGEMPTHRKTRTRGRLTAVRPIGSKSAAFEHYLKTGSGRELARRPLLKSFRSCRERGDRRRTF